MKNNYVFDNRKYKYSIREVKVSDASKLSYFYKNLSLETRKLFKPHSFEIAYLSKVISYKSVKRVIILNSRNIIVGYAFVSLIAFNNSGYFGIAIGDNYQGKNLGFALMSHIFDICKNNHFKNIILNVYSDNTQAVNLYKKYGFKPYSIPKSVRYYIITKELMAGGYIFSSEGIKTFFKRSHENHQKSIWMIKEL